MWYIAALHILVFVIYYTDSGSQLVAIAVRQVILATFYEHYIYIEKITVSGVLIKLGLVVGVFVVNSLLALIIVYIS